MAFAMSVSRVSLPSSAHLKNAKSAQSKDGNLCGEVVSYVDFSKASFGQCKGLFFGILSKAYGHSSPAKVFFLSIISFFFGNGGARFIGSILCVDIKKCSRDFANFPGDPVFYCPIAVVKGDRQFEARFLSHLNLGAPASSKETICFTVDGNGRIDSKDVKNGFYNVAGCGEKTCATIFVYEGIAYNVDLDGDGTIKGLKFANDSRSWIQLNPANGCGEILYCCKNEDGSYSQEVYIFQDNAPVQWPMESPRIFQTHGQSDSPQNKPSDIPLSPVNTIPVEYAEQLHSIVNLNSNVGKFIVNNIPLATIMTISTINKCPIFHINKSTKYDSNELCYGLTYNTPSEINSFLQQEMPIMVSGIDSAHGQFGKCICCNGGKTLIRVDHLTYQFPNYNLEGFFATNMQTSCISEEDRKYAKGGWNINFIGNAYITASPIIDGHMGNTNDNLSVAGDVKLNPAFLRTIYDHDIGIIVDIANIDDDIYMQPGCPLPGKKSYIDLNEFSDWKLVSYSDGKYNNLQYSGENVFPNELISDGLFSDRSINHNLQNNYISTNYKNKPLNYLKFVWRDGCGINDMAQLQNYCEKIFAVSKGNPPLFHCNAGMGRSATLLCAYQLYELCVRAKNSGVQITCDFNNQKFPDVDGKFNLAWAVRNLIISGRLSRQVFIQTSAQFKCLWQFTEHLAKEFGS
jgi:hypothetical protein